MPSADNAQPVDWLVFDDPSLIEKLSRKTVAVFEEKLHQDRKNMRAIVEDIEDFERIIQQQAQGLDPIFFKAPVLLMAHVPVEDSFGRDDATYAAYNLMLAAQRMGMGSCLIGYFIYALENDNQLKSRLGLPDGVPPGIVSSVDEKVTVSPINKPAIGAVDPSCVSSVVMTGSGER